MMRDRVRLAAGAILALCGALGTAALSRVPYDHTRGEGAVLRLSWRARGEAVKECRTLSAEELERLPPHMRRAEVCEGRVLPYLLTVELDGREVVRDSIHGAGARQDRPLYVFRELPVPPGAHRVTVRFLRERPAGHRAEMEDEEERKEEEAREAGRGEWSRLATPARLELDATARLGAGEVGLVTYDPDARALLLRVDDAETRDE